MTSVFTVRTVTAPLCEVLLRLLATPLTANKPIMAGTLFRSINVSLGTQFRPSVSDQELCTRCTHEFMFFVWFSEQSAIISLTSINWLVFVTVT
jgi:hypothetical protein